VAVPAPATAKPVAPVAQAAAEPKPAEEKPAAEAPKAAAVAPPAKPVEEPAAKAPTPLPAPIVITGDNEIAVAAEPSFLARYQLFITSLVMLVTAFGILGVIFIQRVRDRRAEMQAIAAALRGELMAARAVCLARLQASEDDKDIIWPRIRSTLYQAYVGRI